MHMVQVVTLLAPRSLMDVSFAFADLLSGLNNFGEARRRSRQVDKDRLALLQGTY